MRKLSVILALVLLFSTVLAFPAEAASPIGNLSCWNTIIEKSSDYTLGYWPTSPNMVFNKLNNDAAFKLNLATAAAMDAWSAELPITLDFVSNPDTENYVLEVCGGTLDELTEIGASLSIGQAGYTRTDLWTEVGKFRLNGQIDVSAHEITKMTAFIVSITGKTLEQYKNTVTHEVGHALGYYGHSPNSDDVMWETTTSNYTLTDEEVAHLLQAYTLRNVQG